LRVKNMFHTHDTPAGVDDGTRVIKFVKKVHNLVGKNVSRELFHMTEEKSKFYDLLEDSYVNTTKRIDQMTE
jgi:hypothetical protein